MKYLTVLCSILGVQCVVFATGSQSPQSNADFDAQLEAVLSSPSGGNSVRPPRRAPTSAPRRRVLGSSSSRPQESQDAHAAQREKLTQPLDMERCYLTNYIDELKAFADGGDLDAQVLWADSQLRVSDEVINAYRDAAEKGNKYGQFRYAECLLSGISIVRDSGERTEFISANPDEALRLLSLSSSQGHPHAKCLLAAQLYSSDKERAIELYEEAAGLGDTASMFALTTITDNIEPLLRGGWSHKWEIAPLWTKSLEYSVPNWPGTSR